MAKIVDFSKFDRGGQERDEMLQEWNEALKTVGFLQIINHGVPQELLDSLHALALSFFHLPMEEKMKICRGVGYGRGGYVPQGVEAVARSTGAKAPPDLVESLVWKGKNYSVDEHPDMIPSFPPSFYDVGNEYIEQMRKLLAKIMKVSALALSLDEAFFEPYFQDPSCTLRFGYYPPREEAGDDDAAVDDGNEEDENAHPQRYGAHTDYTGFTILYQNAAGLQVKMQDGSWEDIAPVAGAFVINAGDLIQRWTNDKWLSNLHRVVTNSVVKERLSMVYFTGPDDSAVIEAIPTTVDEGSKPKYPSVTARDHLLQKIAATNV